MGNIKMAVKKSKYHNTRSTMPAWWGGWVENEEKGYETEFKFWKSAIKCFFLWIELYAKLKLIGCQLIRLIEEEIEEMYIKELH